MFVKHGEPLDVKREQRNKTTRGKGTLRTTVRRSSG
jgi:hypothetical protein